MHTLNSPIKFKYITILILKKKNKKYITILIKKLQTWVFIQE